TVGAGIQMQCGLNKKQRPFQAGPTEALCVHWLDEELYSNLPFMSSLGSGRNKAGGTGSYWASSEPKVSSPCS
ncbi:hypothetical protein HispidOSU_014574, partial [Sigmodon hispidus]